MLKIEVGKEYMTRSGLLAFVYKHDEDRPTFPFRVRYSDGTEDTVTSGGRFSSGSDSPRDLVCLADERSRMYRFFSAPHTGVLSDKWKEYEE